MNNQFINNYVWNGNLENWSAQFLVWMPTTTSCSYSYSPPVSDSLSPNRTPWPHPSKLVELLLPSDSSSARSHRCSLVSPVEESAHGRWVRRVSAVLDTGCCRTPRSPGTHRRAWTPTTVCLRPLDVGCCSPPLPWTLGPQAYSVSSAVDPAQAVPSERSCFRSTHRPASPQRRPCRLHRHQPVSAAPGAAGSCSGWGFQASRWGFRGAGMFDYYFQVLY